MTLYCPSRRAKLILATPIIILVFIVGCATGPEESEISSQAVSQPVEEIAVASDLYQIEVASDLYQAESLLADESAEPPEKEIEIPVIEPKKVKPRKAYIEPRIRVRLLGSAYSIELGGEENLSLSFGENVLKIDPGTRIRFQPRSARVSVRSYAVGIATYNADEYDEAMKFAEKWKDEGYTVRLIKAGGPLVQANGSIADTTLYWVALGAFKTNEAAEKFRDRMFRRGISCWVIDESLLEPRGNIEIRDARGKAMAYADSRVVVASDKPIKIYRVPFGTGFWSSGKYEDRRYTGPIEIIVDKHGKLAAIDEVGLEEYVKGVVPVEIRLSAHEEALKTQAVSARTEAMAKLGIKHVYDPYDYCASQHCQEFGGLARRTRRTNAAVDATRGEVIVWNGSFVDAVYSANCGGHSEHNELVWSSRPSKPLRGVSDLYSNPESFRAPLPSSQLRRWLTSVPRAYCADRRVGDRYNFRWKITHSAWKISEIVNRHRRVGKVRDIKVLKRGVSGRAIRLKIIGDRDHATINKELQIRRVLGGLKSSMFVVDVKRDSSGEPASFTFQGGGWGHGVGMCQAGAEGMALRGFKYTEILKHYFSGVKIKKMYE